MSHKNLITVLGYTPKENTIDVFSKTYPTGYEVKVDFKNELFDFGSEIKAESKTTQNFAQGENWVILECVDRLLEKGYSPSDITLEKTFPSGHGHSGRLDIFVEQDGKAFLMIECKTYGKEFEKEEKNIYKNGGQLFTYFQNDRSARVLVLYASQLNTKGEVSYTNLIVNIEDEYRETTNVKDFYDRWNKLPKTNGIFDHWVRPYGFQSKALTIGDLRDIEQEDSSFIFSQFLEILRHNVVSDKPNAFNKIFTLFLCKIYDEKSADKNQELAFQWFYSPYVYNGMHYQADDHISFQKRLTDLYGKGMREFLEKEVTDISDADFELKYGGLDKDVKSQLLDAFTEIRLKKNNEFAIKEVFNDDSFQDNAKVVKEVVELLQGFKIRYTKKQQYLSDFFELLLTTGLKQESGQFFTPVPIAQFIIKSLPIDTLVEQKLNEGNSKDLLPTIIDYAAGSGHFITESMHEVQRILDKTDSKRFIDSTAKKIRNWQDDHFDWAYKYVYGIEKDYRLVKVGKVGCYLHGDGLAQIIHSDGLGNFKENKEYKGLLKKADSDFPQENKQFDIVVSNPPYSVSSFRNNARKYYTEKDFKIYDSLTDNSSEIECLFIERTMQLLKDGGITGIILPSSILSNTGIYTRAREIIIEYFDIVAIAELGSNTFMATGTNTVTLFLRKRNNYEVINLKTAVSDLISNPQDITLNGVEKALSKYIAHVWEDISLADYQSLLKQEPNATIQAHEIYKEYKKKLKAKTTIAWWNQLLKAETEKLRYFIITFPQKTVLLKTGSKNEEKRFLGYEFSNRRGSEGIHAIQRSKSIEECTQLFDEHVFDNPEKASTYIYKAFNNELDLEIPEDLQKNISYHNLVEMLTFDRVDFEKNISLSVKKKVKIESKWEQIRLRELAKKIINGSTPPKNDSSFWNSDDVHWLTIQDLYSNRKGIFSTKKFVSQKAVKENKVRLIPLKSVLISCTATVGKVAVNEIELVTNQQVNAIVCNEKINPYYLASILGAYGRNLLDLTTNSGVQHINLQMLGDFKIPLPPLEIQQKIIEEIEILEKDEESALKNLDQLRLEISESVDLVESPLIKLGEITSKIGSGATPKGGKGSYQTSGISLIRSQNIYDYGFVKKGLAFINEAQAKKLDNVTVLQNDILFNITGASIARCCVVEDKYLPARVNQHVSIIRVNEKALYKYVQMILVSNKYKEQLLEIGEGGTSRQAITKLQLEEFKIPLPPLQDQQKIVTQIEKIEKQIATLQEQIATIPQQKEAILKKYL